MGGLARSKQPALGSGVIAEAPSVRKDEIFRATKTGLEKVQTSKLRSGGRHQRSEELPYHRIASLSYEERITTRGSKALAALGILLLLIGLGAPAITSILSTVSSQVPGSRISGLTGALEVPNLVGAALGVALLAARFPRRTKEGWWQVKGQDLTHDDQGGWQVAGGQKGTEELVRAVREGISQSARPAPTKTP